MNDCQNAEIRDQLPDLLHDRLDASRRAEVLAHVASCEDCRDEFALLRAARAMFDARTPRVDVRYVVNGLPLAKPRPVRVEPRRSRWTDWRIAAAVTLLVAGGSSIAVLRSDRGAPALLDTAQTVQATPLARVPKQPDTAASSERAQPAPAPNTTPSPTAVVASEDHGLGSSRLGDLTEQQLQTLLDEIDQLQTTPITEPEPVSLRVGGSAPTGPEGT